jgi:hypothetical protein
VISLKVLTGNNTGTQSWEKHLSQFNEDGGKVGIQNKTFLLLGNSRDIKPDKP